MTGHYLLFNRNCEEAVKTYENAFNAEVKEMRKYKDMPPNPAFPVPESDMELVLHSKLIIGGMELMCADSSRPVTAGDSMYVSITTKDEDLILNAWNILRQGGEIYMDLSPSFFAKNHGSLRDKYGINWMFTALK